MYLSNLRKKKRRVNSKPAFAGQKARDGEKSSKFRGTEKEKKVKQCCKQTYNHQKT